MTRRNSGHLAVTAGLALAALALAAPRSLRAQADSGQAPADSMKPAAAAAGQLVPPTGVPGYVAGHARALHLTPKQVDRVHKVHVWLVGADSAARSQWKDLTGGRTLRAMDPAERRRLAPQLQPIMQQLRTNNTAALDSVDAILTPPQQQKLQTMFAAYRPRMHARPAQPTH